jgi:hypothetical protein
MPSTQANASRRWAKLLLLLIHLLQETSRNATTDKDEASQGKLDEHNQRSLLDTQMLPTALLSTHSSSAQLSSAQLSSAQLSSEQEVSPSSLYH